MRLLICTPNKKLVMLKTTCFIWLGCVKTKRQVGIKMGEWHAGNQSYAKSLKL